LIAESWERARGRVETTPKIIFESVLIAESWERARGRVETTRTPEIISREWVPSGRVVLPSRRSLI
jgi:hypothetical protein